MIRIQNVAEELAAGNIEQAAQTAFEAIGPDKPMDLELIEVVRQALIRSLKDGCVDKAKRIIREFDLPQDLAHEAIKHAIISSYYDGDLKGMLQVIKKMDLPAEVLDEVAEYCESWGRCAEARAMQEVFSHRCECCA